MFISADIGTFSKQSEAGGCIQGKRRVLKRPYSSTDANQRKSLIYPRLLVQIQQLIGEF